MAESLFFLFIFIPIVVYVGFMFLTKRGRGIMFGGRIIKTYDGIKAKRKIVSNSVKIHAVDGGPVRFVGMELKITTPGSYQMIPISFPESEARQLAELIVEACDYKEGT